MKNPNTEHLITKSTTMERALYIILGVLFFSCQWQKPIEPPAPSIKGDWQGTIKYEDPFAYRNNNRYLSFEDSLCTNSMPWGANLKYYIKHDTVFFESAVVNKDYQKYQYAILKLTSDSLILLSPATSVDAADTIVLSRIRKKNSILPSAIYFASSSCFGSCPVVHFKIDSLHNFTYFGSFFTDPVGGHSGKISAAEYETILNQINNLPLDSLKSYYRAPWTDDRTLGVAIEAGGQLIKSAAYGNYKEPIELTILLDKLINTYKHIPLSYDTTVTIEYFTEHPAGMPTTELLTPAENN
jgi:hypothetical protein